MKSKNLDLLWGSEAIATELSISTRKAFYLLEKKAIPAKKVGGRWVADRYVLRKFFVEVVENEGR